jgi:YegS/Rv2252/BmrU family lipid kinase
VWKDWDEALLRQRFAARGEPVVIAAGGDGTLNEVVSGLAGTSTILGVLPAGTMNVFAREMGIPFDSLDRALAVIDSGHIREVDLFEANGSPFVQMAGIGFDARVIEETTWESKKMLGPLAYLLAAVKVLGEQPPHMEVVCADGRREQGVAVLAGNGSLYGGQFRLFRNADNHDSKLDVIVYKEAGYKLVLDSLRGLALGGIDLMESTTYVQTEGFHRACRPRGAGGGGRRVGGRIFRSALQGNRQPPARARAGWTAGRKLSRRNPMKDYRAPGHPQRRCHRPCRDRQNPALRGHAGLRRQAHPRRHHRAGKYGLRFPPDEKEHQQSIHATVMAEEWLGRELNMIDCPGTPDFISEPLSALRVADSAMIVISGVNGVETGADEVWAAAAAL